MADPFISEIRPFAFNFAPRNWAMCNGQLMPIPQNTALFSLLGTTYGGDGRTTFALPNLQGRIAVGAGAGQGLTPRQLGESGGAESVVLTQSEIPAHRHEMKAAVSRSSIDMPDGAVLSTSTGANAYSTSVPTSPLSQTSISTVEGHHQPHENRMPYITVNFCIALYGIFPQRP